MNKQQRLVMQHVTGGRLNTEEFNDLIAFVDTLLNDKKPLKRLVHLAGRAIRRNAEIIIIFRFKHKYYPATENNTQIFETYLHTADISYLDKLEDEVQL